MHRAPSGWNKRNVVLGQGGRGGTQSGYKVKEAVKEAVKERKLVRAARSDTSEPTQRFTSVSNLHFESLILETSFFGAF